MFCSKVFKSCSGGLLDVICNCKVCKSHTYVCLICLCGIHMMWCFSMATTQIRKFASCGCIYLESKIYDYAVLLQLHAVFICVGYRLAITVLILTMEIKIVDFSFLGM